MPTHDATATGLGDEVFSTDPVPLDVTDHVPNGDLRTSKSPSQPAGADRIGSLLAGATRYRDR